MALGRKYTFVMALAVGYLLEIMTAHAGLHQPDPVPRSGYAQRAGFGQSERKLEEERTLGRRTNQWNPHLRTPLCAALSVTVFEAVHLLYTYLSGVSLDAGHWRRALIDVLYSMFLAGVLQFPVRWWLGV